MPKMIAIHDFPYAEHHLVAGQEFECEEKDVYILTLGGYARAPSEAERNGSRQSYDTRVMEADRPRRTYTRRVKKELH